MKSPAARLAEESAPIARIMQSLDQCHAEKESTDNPFSPSRFGGKEELLFLEGGQLDPTILRAAPSRERAGAAFCD